MNEGIVRTWFDGKGYGFLSPDDGSDDLFVHATAVSGVSGRVTLIAGQRVRYIVGEHNGRRCATSCMIIDDAPPVADFE